jgi:Na+-driven multidrug efflux pump
VDGLAVALLQSLGLVMTISTEQNLGAGHIDRVRVGVRHGLTVACVAAAGIGVIVIVLGRLLVRLFVGTGVDTVVAMSHLGLTVNGSLYIVLAVLFTLRGTLQGLG